MLLKKEKTSKFITDDKQISCDDFDKQDFDEENSDEEN